MLLAGDNPPPNLLLPDKLWRFVWPASRRADPVFVHHLFQQPEFRRKIGQAATGTSGSMKNVSQAKVLAIVCGLPPMDMQLAFVERMSCVDQLRQSAVRHQGELEALHGSLEDRAFGAKH